MFNPDIFLMCLSGACISMVVCRLIFVNCFVIYYLAVSVLFELLLKTTIRYGSLSQLNAIRLPKLLKFTPFESRLIVTIFSYIHIIYPNLKSYFSDNA